MYNCAKNPKIHQILKSRYVELILVMFVTVGENRSYLDHLCYSFVRELSLRRFYWFFLLIQVYDDLSAKPYEESGQSQTMALTGVENVHFPDLKIWILDTLKANKVCHNFLLIIHNN